MELSGVLRSCGALRGRSPPRHQLVLRLRQREQVNGWIEETRSGMHQVGVPAAATLTNHGFALELLLAGLVSEQRSRNLAWLGYRTAEQGIVHFSAVLGRVSLFVRAERQEEKEEMTLCSCERRCQNYSMDASAPRTTPKRSAGCQERNRARSSRPWMLSLRFGDELKPQLHTERGLIFQRPFQRSAH